MLAHAYNLLHNKGELLILNQGEEEYDIQKKMNEKLGVKSNYLGEIEDDLNIFGNKRFCSKIIKN